MLAMLVAALLKLASSGLIERTLAVLKERADTATERERITATVAIEEVRAERSRRAAQRDILLAEQGNRVTALMRPVFAYPLAIYYAAVIADSLFKFRWNVAALPDPIGDWSGWIISAIFLSESGERITRTLVRRKGA
jgi:hypothetical protein